MARPETKHLPESFYTIEEAHKYDQNKRTMHIQKRMTERCYELINKPGGIILDIGCGTGHGIEVLKKAYEDPNIEPDKNDALFVVGLDISEHMLEICRNKNFGTELVQFDIGNFLPFQPASFNGVISVSCLQWLFYAYNKEKIEKRLHLFFSSLYCVLKRTASACLQFYFENKWQIDLLMKTCKRIGFSGGIIVDGNNKSKKYYLLLDLITKTPKFEVVDHNIFSYKKANNCRSKITKKSSKKQLIKENVAKRVFSKK